MDYDREKVDRTVLALLYLTMWHERDGAVRAWKGQDFDVMDRLHEQGYIFDPRSKAKSVMMTEEGEAEAKRLFRDLFGNP